MNNMSMHDDTQHAMNDATGHAQTSVGHTNESTINHASIKILFRGYEYEVEFDFEDVINRVEYDDPEPHYPWDPISIPSPPRVTHRIFEFAHPYNYKGRIIDHNYRQSRE